MDVVITNESVLSLVIDAAPNIILEATTLTYFDRREYLEEGPYSMQANGTLKARAIFFSFFNCMELLMRILFADIRVLILAHGIFQLLICATRPDLFVTAVRFRFSVLSLIECNEMWSAENATHNDKTTGGFVASEDTPLLVAAAGRDSSVGSARARQHWKDLRNVTSVGIAFRRGGRRRRLRREVMGASPTTISGGGSVVFPHDVDAEAQLKEDQENKGTLEPSASLEALCKRHILSTRSRPLAKSIPAFAPYRRKARHRSFYLFWINEFRHWWKSSRLLVRLGGLYTLARQVWPLLVALQPTDNKSLQRAFKFAKHLGQGGPMRGFLRLCKPWTRLIRLVVAVWRWVEASQCRRLEVGVEEAMAFMGNRVARMLSRTMVDDISKDVIFRRSSPYMFGDKILPAELWHPAMIILFLGFIRSIAPYAASFQGSRVGRVLTRAFFASATHRWRPIQRVHQLNLHSDDCAEQDEIDENAALAKLAKKVAKALGKSQKPDINGGKGQAASLAEEGFRPVGAGSGGYAVYECHRRLGTLDTVSFRTLILHVTPYGPSILNVMPRYIVLELEESQDRRAAWSETLAALRVQGPSIVEGFCYEGAFFSKHHFAAMKSMHDKQLHTYDRACASLSQTRMGPPTDLMSLKKFLVEGKLGRKRKKNDIEYSQLQRRVKQLANKLKTMMLEKSSNAPNGIILYFEGLDCSGKSSTGGLVQQALELAGFQVEMCQYNRPPTKEQKQRPWMDRFAPPEVPDSEEFKSDNNVEATRNAVFKAVVWDRGPAGDFVYGELASASVEEKRKHYNEFMVFDAECKRRNILLCKLLFVTNRDSIASTLGKRLAQRKMAGDLSTWLQASRGDSSGAATLEGLDAIKMHIDPTDFVAFNLYQKNLYKFVNFAANTETSANPWIVVNTTNRHAARMELLRVFETQLDAFHQRRASQFARRGVPAGDVVSSPNIDLSDMIERRFKERASPRALLALMGIVFLVWYYAAHTEFDSFFHEYF